MYRFLSVQIFERVLGVLFVAPLTVHLSGQMIAVISEFEHENLVDLMNGKQ